MLRATGLKNGSIFMQACVKDNNVYFYETGMRLNGCKIYQIVDAEHGYNALERLINSLSPVVWVILRPREK